jgi:RNA polymerase sigma-70 factor (ECF subfamily)
MMESVAMADEVFRQALTTLLPRLRRFGMTLTGSRTDAEELVQNTCERVLLRAEQLRDQTRMDAWLFGIMRNIWNSELRKLRIRRHEGVEAAENVVGDDGPAVVEGRMTLDAVRRAMASLPQEQRAVLMLVCVDGLSYKSAAEVMDIPVGTVMSRLSRARLELNSRLTVAAPAKVTELFPSKAPPKTDRSRPAKAR